MRRYTERCEEAIRDNHPQAMVDNTSQIARLGNRVLMAAKNEADNSEDPVFVGRVNSAASKLQGCTSSLFVLAGPGGVRSVWGRGSRGGGPVGARRAARMRSARAGRSSKLTTGSSSFPPGVGLRLSTARRSLLNCPRAFTFWLSGCAGRRPTPHRRRHYRRSTSRPYCSIRSFAYPFLCLAFAI